METISEICSVHPITDAVQKLRCAVKGAHSEGKAHEGEHAEGHPLEQHDCRRAGTEQAEAQKVYLPRHRIDLRRPAKPPG